MSVREELKAIGGELIGAGFNQSAFRASITVTGVDLTGGYCSGVCLDWARRVLQSAPDRDTKTAQKLQARGIEGDFAYMSYSKPAALSTPVKRLGTVTRMAEAYNGHASFYVSGATKKQTALQELRKLKTVPEKNYGEESYGKGHPVPNELARLFEEFWVFGQRNTHFGKFALDSEPAGVLSDAAIEWCISNLTGRADPQHQARSADGRHWETFASQLDQRLNAERLSETGGTRGAKKLFSNIEVVRNSPTKVYATAGQWAHALETNGFLVNCCTIVSFSPTAGGSGHAVAAYQTGQVGAKEFVFFDPNYGAFHFSKDKLANCFQHLFWTPAITVDTSVRDHDKAVYLRRDEGVDKEEGTWNKMGYTIFKKTDA